MLCNSERMSGVRCFENGPEGANVAWRGVKGLWEQKLLCDVKLVVNEHVFQVHRCYLASCSQYFYIMFTQGFKESLGEEVLIHGITATGLGGVLQYMYTGTIEISSDNVNDVLQAASMLQVEDLQTFCIRYITEGLTVENCIESLQLAEMYSLHKLSHEIHTFMLENYSFFGLSNTFLTKCSLELLLQLLEDDLLNVDSELTVFNSAVRWLQHETCRLVHSSRVLGLVRFGLMTPGEMDIVKSDKIFQQPECAEVLKNSLDCHSKTDEYALMHSILTRPRSHITSLVVVAVTDSSYDKSLTLASPLHKKVLGEFFNIETVTDVSEQRLDVGAVVVNNCLYIVGGTFDEDVCATTFKYNPVDDKWVQLASMLEQREKFALVALSDCLVAVGGMNDRSYLNSVEKYSFTEDRWSYLQELEASVESHAGCALNECVYISGGSYHVAEQAVAMPHTDLVQCYNPVLGAWIQKSPLNHRRRNHVMAAHGNKLFVFGGEGGLDYPDIAETEMYCTETDQWSVLALMPSARDGAASACYGSCVYIVGGDNVVEEDNCDYILRFDMDSLQWTELKAKLPEFAHWAFAGFLQVPRKLYLKYDSASLATGNS